MTVSLQEVVTIFTALGVGGALQQLGRGLWQHYTGRAERERTTIRSATRDRDEEAAYRRVMQEHASELRVLAITAGVDPDDLPGWPERPTRKAPPTAKT